MDERYPQGFRPLFAAVAEREPEITPAPPPAAEPVAPPPKVQPPAPCACERGALHEVALFRATLREALESRVHAVLAKLAADVLARELLLAPPDIRGLVSRALAECGADDILELRLAPHDAARFPQSGVPVRVDAGLQAGEFAIDARSGTFESRLPTRLEALVDELHA